MAACRFSCPALRVRARAAPAPAAPSAAAVTYCSFFSIKSRPFLLWWVSCPQLTTPDGPPPCTKTARCTKTVHRACFVRLQAFLFRQEIADGVVDAALHGQADAAGQGPVVVLHPAADPVQHHPHKA